MMRRESGLALSCFTTSAIWSMWPPSGCRPAAPLHAVDRAEVAVGLRPLVPDRHAAFLQPLRVAVAAQEPQQFEDDGLEVHLLRRDQREALAQVETHLVAEHAFRAGAGAVGLRTPWSCTWRMKSSYCAIEPGVWGWGPACPDSRMPPRTQPCGRRLAQEDLDPAVLRAAGVGAVVGNRLARAAALRSSARRGGHAAVRPGSRARSAHARPTAGC
jgi:hypothetical protein